MLKILQVNLGRASAAHDMAWATAMASSTDVLIITEPNKKLCEKNKWYTDKKKDVAIALVNNTVLVNKVYTCEHFVHVQLGETHIYGVYV